MATSGVVLSPVKDESIFSARSHHFRNCLPDGIQIYLATADSVIPMRVLASDTIASVKLKIQAYKGFYVKQQKLVYGGRELARSESLIKDYGVTDGNVLHLVLRVSDLQAVTVKTASGKEFVFQVEKNHSIRDLKQRIAQKEKGLGLDEQELIFKGTKLEDQRLVDDVFSENDAIVHLFVRKTAKVRTKVVRNDVELCIIASDESDITHCKGQGDGQIIEGISSKLPLPLQEEPKKYRDDYLQCREVVRRSPKSPCLLEPLTRSSKHKLSPAFQDLIKSIKGGLEYGQSPIRSEEGSGGAYFMRDSTGTKYIGVFKPIDEEPMAENNPRGLPVSLNGEGLKKGTRVGEGAYREVAAYILDHPIGGPRSLGSDEAGFAGVPPTMMVRCSHSAFYLSNGCDKLGQKTKLGSLQMFVESYSNCEDMGPAAFPVDEVHKITVLDMRLANADRHGGNILACKQGEQSPYRLVPIDHGYCLPESVTEQVDHDDKTNEDSDQMQDQLATQGFDPSYEGENENESYDMMENESDMTKNESYDMTVVDSTQITKDKVQIQNFLNILVGKDKVASIHTYLNQASFTYSFFTLLHGEETNVVRRLKHVDENHNFKVFFKYKFHKFKEKIRVFMMTLRGRMLKLIAITLLPAFQPGLYTSSTSI